MSALPGLQGKNALVTGGSRGIGRAIARLLARSGVDVGIAYRSRDEDAGRTVEAIRGEGVRGWAHRGDLSRSDRVNELFDRVDREFERLDVFVGNAAVWPPEDVSLAEMDLSRWRRTLRVNLDSVFLTGRAAARRVRRGGRIVLISSTAAQRGEAYHGDYAASKGAVNALVKGLCLELGGREVTVNAVAPGWVDTEMAEPAFREGGRERIEAEIPLGRIATAEDVAGPVLFLCSDLGRHVTGEVLNVNGGAVRSG